MNEKHVQRNVQARECEKRWETLVKERETQERLSLNKFKLLLQSMGFQSLTDKSFIRDQIEVLSTHVAWLLEQEDDKLLLKA